MSDYERGWRACREAAARACEETDIRQYRWGGEFHDDARGTLHDAERAIRALEPPAAAAPAPVPRGHCNRCSRCGWTFMLNGCVPGDCAYRPGRPVEPRATCAGCGAPYAPEPTP